jgi:hypothetical protein
MNNIKRSIGLLAITGWSILGFTRGINSYNYYYSQGELYKNYVNKHYIYTDAFMWGLGATLGYLNPFLLPILLGKEIYRLEVNLSGIEHEKKTDRYNKVL